MTVSTYEQPEELGRKLVRWGLYPSLWLIKLGVFYMVWFTEAAPENLAAITSRLVFLTCFVLEWRYPYQKRWAMTWASFWSDLKFVSVISVVNAGISIGLTYFAISTSGDLAGPAHDWPPALQLIASLLIFEALNYTIHRAMHEWRRPIGTWLWKVHAAHHLPPRLYLLMHAVFHPINAVIIRLVVMVLPIWAMGYRQEVVAMFAMIVGLHGLISHFNVDMRMGWANYLFIGPELHRYHHSACQTEGKNYGSVLSIFDQIFGTFVYRPGVAPKELGVSADAGLPNYDQTLAVLALPFKR